MPGLAALPALSSSPASALREQGVQLGDLFQALSILIFCPPRRQSQVQVGGEQGPPATRVGVWLPHLGLRGDSIPRHSFTTCYNIETHHSLIIGKYPLPGPPPQ